ncbi:hypothetical protein [Qipengyuania sp. SM2507]
MKIDPRKLKRARLLERIRTVERSRSALAASEAEATRQRLFGVAERTRSLARHYAQQDDAMIGTDLRGAKAMQDQLQQLCALSEQHAEEAEQRSEATMDELASAERRMRRAEEDRRSLARAIVADLEH